MDSSAAASEIAITLSLTALWLLICVVLGASAALDWQTISLIIARVMGTLVASKTLMKFPGP